MQDNNSNKNKNDGPARRQVSRAVTDQMNRQHDMLMYNIWEDTVNRRGGGPRERGKIIASDYTCHPSRDSGWTRGEKAGTRFICLYFARGLCHHGSDCGYVHRVPDVSFELYHRTQPQYDIFGRERSLEVEGGQKGVGSMSRDCTTLYVYLGALASLDDGRVSDMLRKDFGAWGEVEDVNVVSRKSVGFVRFVLRSSAEFAKVAMHQQILGGDETHTALDVRWANDDPNPKAVERVKAKREAILADAYIASLERCGPEERAARLAEIGLHMGHREDAVTSSYPVIAATRAEEEEEEEEDDDDIRRYLTPEELEEIENHDRKRPRVEESNEDQGEQSNEEEDEEQSANQEHPLAGVLAGYESS